MVIFSTKFSYLEGTILCMETSLDERILFAGGGTHDDLKYGKAKLFALSFDEHLDYVSDLVLPAKGANTMGVSDIKRMKDRDVLFAGTNGALFVVEWTGSHFVVLNLIENIHKCRFFDFIDF